jgi:hypothetical protein
MFERAAERLRMRSVSDGPGCQLCHHGRELDARSLPDAAGPAERMPRQNRNTLKERTRAQPAGRLLRAE